MHDLPAVTALESAAQAFPWQIRHFSDSLAAGDSAWVLRRGSELLGFCIIMVGVDEAHLLNIAVHPDVQGQGLGARLLRHGMVWAAERGLQSMFLEVRPSNERAEALYRHLGFIQVGRRKNYYPAYLGREDALVYCRALEDLHP